MAQVDHVPHLCRALLLRGVGDDGGVGIGDEFVVGPHFRHADVRQHVAFGQQPPLAIEDGAQQRVAVDESLHQQVGLALPYESHGFLRGRALVHIVYVDGLGESHFAGAFHGPTGVFVGGADHGHALSDAAFQKVGRHIIKVPDRFHRLFFFVFRPFAGFLSQEEPCLRPLAVALGEWRRIHFVSGKRSGVTMVCQANVVILPLFFA